MIIPPRLFAWGLVAGRGGLRRLERSGARWLHFSFIPVLWEGRLRWLSLFRLARSLITRRHRLLGLGIELRRIPSRLHHVVLALIPTILPQPMVGSQRG